MAKTGLSSISVQFAGDGGHLAPHGVPSAPMPRALSSSKLEEQENDAQSATAAGPNLAVPGESHALLDQHLVVITDVAVSTPPCILCHSAQQSDNQQSTAQADDGKRGLSGTQSH